MTAAMREDAWGRETRASGENPEPRPVKKGAWYNVILAADQSFGETEVRSALEPAWTVMTARPSPQWDSRSGRLAGWEVLGFWVGDDTTLLPVIVPGKIGYISIDAVDVTTRDGWGRPA